MEAPWISLVIPAWNEAGQLPRLLASVAAARAAFPHGSSAIEVIVADNGSTDGTAEIALRHGARVVAVEQRCIAAARNGGAAAARGGWLAFVDADSILHRDSFLVLAAALADPTVVGGATGVTMERWSAGIALTYALMLPMVWMTCLDSGVVFCRRADFQLLGGYDQGKLIAEDLDFLLRLRRLGRSRRPRERICRVRGAKTVTSTRKFDRYGDWHFFSQMPRIAWHWLRNPAAFRDHVQRYWYDGR